MTTFYPHLQLLVDGLNKGLSLSESNGIKAITDESQITIQGDNSLFLIPRETEFLQVITNVRSISSVRCNQVWAVVSVIRDSEDQLVTTPLINRLGELQYKVIKVLGTDILGKGGPIQLLESPEPEPIKGGAIVGRIRFGTQFVLNLE